MKGGVGEPGREMNASLRSIFSIAQGIDLHLPCYRCAPLVGISRFPLLFRRALDTATFSRYVE